MPFVACATQPVPTPRDYQAEATEAGRRDMASTGGALVVVPTGGGKTLIMGETLDGELNDEPNARVLVLQHTTELLDQNMARLCNRIAHRDTLISIVKSRQNDWEGQVVFGSTPTVARRRRLEQAPAFTHLMVDEGHRLGAAGAKRIVAHLRRLNPKLKIITYTATPNRSDGSTIAYAVGEGCSYQITYAELIDRGVLVAPKTLTIDLGLNSEIEALPKSRGDYDMDTIGTLLNREIHNEAVFEHWQEHAADRLTIGFCPTVAHARALASTFRAHGVVAEAIWGEMDPDLRGEILERYEAGTIQVIFNCAVLIEGYDAPRTAAIINLRPCLEEITWLQSIGRGLRSLDPVAYPEETKTNCVILDFTGAAQRHGTLELRVQEEREAKLRSITQPKASEDHSRDMRPSKPKLRDFTMKEVNLITAVKQPFLFDDTVCQHGIAHNNFAWAAAFCWEGRWHALARVHHETVRLLASGTRFEVVTAVDMFLRADPSGRMPRDVREGPVTPDQRAELRRWKIAPSSCPTFYHALCKLSVLKAQHQIREVLMSVEQPGWEYRRAA